MTNQTWRFWVMDPPFCGDTSKQIHEMIDQAIANMKNQSSNHVVMSTAYDEESKIFSVYGVDRAEQQGDHTVTMTVEIDYYMHDPRFSSYVEYQRHLAMQETARNQRAKRKGRRRLNPQTAWRIEAKRARRMALEAVRVAHGISAPTGDWRRERKAAQIYIHARHVAVRLLCRATCAWARARVLAHMAGDAAGLAYCTRGLHAAQAAPRPPTWVQDVGEPPMAAEPPGTAPPPMDALAPTHTPPSPTQTPDAEPCDEPQAPFVALVEGGV